MNVIWIVSDSLRTDAIGAYGNKKMHTPAMDALAAKSIRFDRHYIGSFPTMPARADHMTGRWTVSFMSWEPLPKKVVTLPQILSGAGIFTAAAVDTPFYIRGGMNYDRGFASFEEIPGQLWMAKGSDPRFRGNLWERKNAVEAECCAAQTFSKAMQWLELNHKEKFFLYIDTWDPHEPWNAPDYFTKLYMPDYDGEIVRPLYGRWPESPNYTEAKVKKARATYNGEVTMVDSSLGCLMRKIENLGLLENTAIILTSDHGYYFGEHGGLFGKMVFAKDSNGGRNEIGIWSRSPYYEEITRIPLLIYIPGLPANSYNGLTSAIDMMPTVLDLMGQKGPDNIEGRSLLPMIKNPKKTSYEQIFSSSSFVNAGGVDNSVDGVTRLAEKASMATVTTDEWTLLYDIEPGGSELYNLKTDPKQEKNVIGKHHDVAKELHKLFVKHMKDTKVPQDKMTPRLELKL
jgi:arylsulfatase A-like enzyme